MKCSICGEDSPIPTHITCAKPPPDPEPVQEPTEVENIINGLNFARADLHKRTLEDFGSYVKFRLHWVEQLNWDQISVRESLPERPVPTHRLYKMYKDGREEFIRYVYEG